MLAALTHDAAAIASSLLQLHAPDGFLSLPVAGVMWALTIGVVGIAVRRTDRTLDPRAVPMLGVAAAFIFAAQMVNFPVAGGTSGHLLGGVLAAILVGPWAGTLVMACVVAVQSLVYQDGGLVVLGANIFNMGIVGTLGGFFIYRAVARVLGGEERARIPAAAIAAWLAVVAGAALTAVQLAVSGVSPLGIALPAMVGFHVVIGLGEALITAGALTFIALTRADLLRLREPRVVRQS